MASTPMNPQTRRPAVPVPIEEASRFGIVIADDDKRINAFEEKPVHPRSNLASMLFT